MKDFGQWFKEQKPVDTAKLERDAHIARLEDADVIFHMKDGTFMSQCCCCGENTELPVGPEEIDVDYKHYCGGSDRCCP